MLTTTKEMLKKARAEHYAVPAINTQGGNYDIIWAVCRAAEEMGSPAILAHYVSTGAYSGDDWFVQVCKWCASKVRVPIAIHLDHGDGFEICMKSLKNGFTSLMIDGSTHPIEENAAMTNEVLKVAKCFGVPVEAEIGELLRLDAEGAQMENKNVANVEDVKKFLSLCQPDSLAIGIGNAHGYYKGEPDIHLGGPGADGGVYGYPPGAPRLHRHERGYHQESHSAGRGQDQLRHGDPVQICTALRGGPEDQSPGTFLEVIPDGQRRVDRRYQKDHPAGRFQRKSLSSGRADKTGGYGKHEKKRRTYIS